MKAPRIGILERGLHGREQPAPTVECPRCSGARHPHHRRMADPVAPCKPGRRSRRKQTALFRLRDRESIEDFGLYIVIRGHVE